MGKIEADTVVRVFKGLSVVSLGTQSIGCRKCGLLDCACEVIASHAESCRHRLASTCAIPFPCRDHGRDVCPSCDSCDCGAA